MGDIVAAIVGYLIGMEDSRPRIRCHRLACATVTIFLVGNFAVDFFKGADWSTARITNYFLFAAPLYGFTFLVLKWWDHSRARRR